jgi:hypothetical protein
MALQRSINEHGDLPVHIDTFANPPTYTEVTAIEYYNGDDPDFDDWRERGKHFLLTVWI